MMSYQFLVLLILLFFSAFFSAAETALFSISRTRAVYLAKQKQKTLRLIKEMKDDPHRLLATILIGNNIVNVGASALATALTIQMVSHNAVGITTGVMTLVILVFGEFFPKSVATRNNVLIARLVIYPLYWLSILVKPLIFFLSFIPKLTGRIQLRPKVTEEELKTMVEVVEEEGVIKEAERELIYNIFKFDDTNASECMTPRADMFVMDADQEIPMEGIINSGYSRIPVIEGGIDHVVGILHVKDLFMHCSISGSDVDVRKIMREPYFVPENKILDGLLQQFKKRKQHMAIVVDEHGGISGLITLEDALEELVGEIVDETDVFEPRIVKLNADEWRVLGKTEIDELNENIPMNVPDTNEYDTFSGFILNTIGRIPKEKEKIPIDNFILTVHKMEGNRIKELIVKKLNKEPVTSKNDTPMVIDSA